MQFQKSTTMSIYTLEVQMGQMAAALTERPHRSLQSNIEKNPREQANAITLKIDKQLEQQQL